MRFNVVEGEPYGQKYEEFIELYNENRLSLQQIRVELDIAYNKMMNYRKQAIEEGKIKAKGGGRKPTRMG